MHSTTMVRPIGGALVQRLHGPSLGTVLRRLTAQAGLVAFSGTWAGGGVLIAEDPIEVVTGDDALFRVFGSAGAGEDESKVGGGWFGWLGYPDATNCWFGRYPNVLRYSRTEKCWYDEALPDMVEEAELGERRRLLRRLLAPETSQADQQYRLGPFTANQTCEQYTAAVERCIDHIRAGDVYQANICLRLDATFTGSITGLFAGLADALNPPYAALVCDDIGAVVSLSPELFLRRRGRTVMSAPIKGTRPRTPAVPPEADAQRHALGTSDKERAENVMIVDLIRNDLGRVADVGSVQTPSLLKIAERCGVWHLISTVSATVPEDATDEALLRATFPPGSVTGAPKLAAQRIIEKLEQDPRGVYTGAVGYLSPLAGLELNVAIRTLRIDTNRASLGVGAGITAGSTPAEEWRECFHKAAPLAAAAGATVTVVERRRPPINAVFETMLVINGQVVEFAAHLQRLERSASQLWNLELPTTLAREMTTTAAAWPAARLRLDLSACADVHVRCRPTAPPVPLDQQDGIAVEFEVVPPGFGEHKSADRSQQERLERAHPGSVVVAIDEQSHCLEATRGNVLTFSGDRVITPPLDGRILPGVTRRAVLDLAHESEYHVVYRPITLADLGQADGFAISGSLTGLAWVHRCAVAQWTAPCGVASELSKALLSRWDGESGLG